MRSDFIWDIPQHRFGVCYRRFGTTNRSQLQGSSRSRN